MRREAQRDREVRQENDARAALLGALNAAEDKLQSAAQEKLPVQKNSRPIEAGDTVELPGVSTPATVQSVGQDGTAVLLCGAMKLTAKVGDLHLVESKGAGKKKVPPAPRRGKTTLPVRSAAAAELDIRGMMTDEAAIVVDRFLDEAVMGRLNQVTIIHGKGTGALRKAVHQQLRRHPYVKGFRLGAFGEGEDGVTVVELK